MTAKKSTKTGKNFRGGGEGFFWLARIYTPGSKIRKKIGKLNIDNGPDAERVQQEAQT